jgi:hypothetical protein
MPKRCGDSKCRSLVNERKPHVRIADLVFCHNGCANEWRVRQKATLVIQPRVETPPESMQMELPLLLS